MALKQYNLEEEEERLGQFILYMKDAFFPFLRHANTQGYQLNEAHTLDSLEDLERYIREKKISLDGASDAALLVRYNCWYYLGEVMRRNFGGSWEFSMDQENDGNWGEYVIVGHSPVQGLEFVPERLFRAFILRGYKPGMFRKGIFNQVKPEPVDLSELAKEQEEEDRLTGGLPE
ncbi:hypothetical protein [Hymenobacter terrenus]|uniref:hypothetical protein n=1 Tax=Hymenobacter terrenus TaxID=1629124 RepID=UPI000697EDDE|nr:hypothetical protein [Hymenobacter terrenus]